MPASNSGTGRFVVGRQKTGGRQKGSTNKATALLKDAFILAASMAGDRLAKQHGLKQGGLVGFLQWAAVKEPAAFLTILGKLIPQQLQVAEKKEVVYATFDDLRRALTEQGFPIDEMRPFFLELKANEIAKPEPSNGSEQ